MTILIASHKYVLTGELEIHQAVERLFADYIEKNDARGWCNAAIHDLRRYRSSQMYNNKMEAVFHKHMKVMRGLWKRYKCPRKFKKKE